MSLALKTHKNHIKTRHKPDINLAVLRRSWGMAIAITANKKSEGTKHPSAFLIWDLIIFKLRSSLDVSQKAPTQHPRNYQCSHRF